MEKKKNERNKENMNKLEEEHKELKKVKIKYYLFYYNTILRNRETTL